jgi:hypothetical protein
VGSPLQHQTKPFDLYQLTGYTGHRNTNQPPTKGKNMAHPEDARALLADVLHGMIDFPEGNSVTLSTAHEIFANVYGVQAADAEFGTDTEMDAVVRNLFERKGKS